MALFPGDDSGAAYIATRLYGENLELLDRVKTAETECNKWCAKYERAQARAERATYWLSLWRGAAIVATLITLANILIHWS